MKGSVKKTDTKTDAIASVVGIDVSMDKMVALSAEFHGMDAGKAVSTLSFMNTKAAAILLKLTKACIANAENNLNLNIDKLFISRLCVGRAYALKRFSPRGRGKSSSIQKVRCSVFLTLSVR